MRLISRIIDTLTESIGTAVSLIAIPIMIIISIEVVSRYFFNHPTRWAWMTATHLFGVFSLFGGAYTLLYKRHIRVEILYERFGSRFQLVSNFITAICFLLFICLLIWQGYIMAAMSIEGREVVRGIIHFPIYPLKTLVPVAAVLFLLQGISNFIRHTRK